MEKELIKNTDFLDQYRSNSGNEAISFSALVHKLIEKNDLETGDVLAELNDKLDELIRRFEFENEPVLKMTIETQGIGKRLTRLGKKEIEEKYHLDTLTVERKKAALLKREKHFIRYIVELLTVILFYKYGNYKFFEYELLANLFDQEKVDLLGLIAEHNKETPISFDRKHYVFYVSSIVNLDHLYLSIVNDMNSIIPFEIYEQSILMIRKLIEEHWTKGQNYYLKKGLTELKMTMAILEEKFPHGYHIQNDFKKLCGYLRKEYGELFEIPASGVITWKLQKDNIYCQIDRGKYLLWSKCPGLDLIEQAEIITYIQNAGDIVYYASILEHFKDEFREKGVTNQYFVKGIVDHYLDGYGYEKNRDFIKTQGSSITGKQAILLKIKEFDGVFSLQQLRNAFPGVKDYTFQIVLQECDEAISLGNNKYVTLENSGVTEVGEEMIISEALSILKATNGRPLIAKKILSKIKLFNEDYKKELGYITTPSALYHFLLKSEKGNELFEFKSPYIALKGTNKDEMNFKSSLRKALGELDEINLDNLRKTIANLGVTKNYPINFVDIVEVMSDDYLLVERYRLVKTSKILVNRNEVEKIKSKILLVITKKKVFNSDVEQNFKGFPKEVGGFEMNEYLVLGIALTYLQNLYECELITKGGKRLSYIIKEA